MVEEYNSHNISTLDKALVRYGVANTRISGELTKIGGELRLHKVFNEDGSFKDSYTPSEIVDTLKKDYGVIFWGDTTIKLAEDENEFKYKLIRLKSGNPKLAGVVEGIILEPYYKIARAMIWAANEANDTYNKTIEEYMNGNTTITEDIIEKAEQKSMEVFWDLFKKYSNMMLSQGTPFKPVEAILASKYLYSPFRSIDSISEGSNGAEVREVVNTN